MGKNPERVWHSGAPGAEFSVESGTEIEKEFREKTGIAPDERFLLLAMHPATLEPDMGVAAVKATLKALDDVVAQGYKVLVTLPNSDPGNQEIRDLQLRWTADNHNRAVAVNSLGARLFHYALSRASAIVGNSSSALIEAPSVRLPAVNIGTRQKGRAQGHSVINADANTVAISDALYRALDPEFRNRLNDLPLEFLNPYYKKDSSQTIADKLLLIL